MSEEGIKEKISNVYALLSALQKAIRRGNERDALEAVWQLDMEPGVSFTRSRGGAMWSIIRRSCAEDVDSLEVLPAIETLWHFWEKQTESRDNTHAPWRLFSFKAVMILCQAPKSRRVDNALTVIPPGRLEATVEEFRKTGKKSFPLPDYAHDGIHTGDGKRSTKLEFMVSEDAVLNPRSPTDDVYFREIIDVNQTTPISPEGYEGTLADRGWTVSKNDEDEPEPPSPKENSRAKRSAAAKKAMAMRAANKAAAQPAPADSLGECESCCDGTLATEVVGVTEFNGDGYKYCAKCADFHRKTDRKYLIRQMGVAKVCGEFWSWKTLPNEPATVDDGEGNAIEMCSKRRYLEALKEKFLGNPRYDQTVVVEHIARLEKRMQEAEK